jgi:GNAT superfamily N-acetyltransferase
VSAHRSIEKLSPFHDVSGFDSGDFALNDWLKRFALQNKTAGMAQTYVGLVDASPAGFYSIAAGEIQHHAAPARLQKGIARHPIPVVLLARLAVDLRWQGQGVGRSLLIDATLRTVQAAEIAGIRALAVHAKDENARRYYEQFGFVSLHDNPLHMVAFLKDLHRHLGTS